MLKSYFSLICSMSLFSLIAAHSIAGETQQAPVSVTVYVQEVLDVKGRPKSIAPSLSKFFQFFERETGLQLIPVSVPWNRAKLMTLDGKGLIWGLSKSPERLARYDFSEAAFKSRIWAIAYGEPKMHLRNVTDLQGKTISVERGVSHGMKFELAKNKIFKVDEDFAQSSSRFRKLLAKRSDVLLWGFVQFDKQDLLLDYLHNVYLPGLRDPELLGKKFYVSPTPLFYDSIHFAASKGHFGKELRKIDEAIQRGTKSGELNHLVQAFD
jgi:ABC-type amino acid transport substrate-binding protein